MEGLIVIAVLVLIGIPVIIITMLASIKSRQSEDTRQLAQAIKSLEYKLERIAGRGIATPPEQPVYTPPAKEIIPEPEITTPPVVEPIPVVESRPVAEEKPAPEIVKEPVPVIEESVIPIITAEPEKTTPPKPNYTIPPNPVKPAKDYERFIGENLAGKIGIGILVLGIGFFVKYAIDREMINEMGRVILGLVSGCILLGIAHFTRKSYRAFSSLLVAGGIATFYFTITIAFQQYGMFGQIPAFIIMVIITAFSVALSLLYDRRELAALSLLGGFGAPFMVSTGQGNYVVLFTYMLILNTGMLVLAHKRQWSIINIMTFVGTVLIYGSWLILEVAGKRDAPYGGALLFASLFYVVFFVMNIIRQVARHEKFTQLQTALLISNSFLYYVAGMAILQYWGHKDYQGIYTACLATFNFIFAFIFHKNQAIDRRLALYQLGLVLVFLSIVAPVQLKGNHITLFWAAEAAMLLWFSQKAQLTLAKTVSLVLVPLMAVSLLMDWAKYYGFGDEHLPLLLNKVVITGIACVASLQISRRLLRTNNKNYHLGITTASNYSIGGLLDVLTVLLGAGIINFEILYQLSQMNTSWHEKALVMLAVNNIYTLSLLLTVRLRKTEKFVPLLISIAFLVLFLNITLNGTYFTLFHEYFKGKPLAMGVAANYFSFAALMGIITLIYILYKAGNHNKTGWLAWGIVFCTVFFLSHQLSFHAVLFNAEEIKITWLNNTTEGEVFYRQVLTQMGKAGYAVLWGLCSFVCMWLGMRYKNKQLRIISLTLFTITLAKLFIYDIKNISEGGRVAAFIILGILLLVISFMYQKIKKIFIDEKPAE